MPSYGHPRPSRPRQDPQPALHPPEVGLQRPVPGPEGSRRRLVAPPSEIPDHTADPLVFVKPRDNGAEKFAIELGVGIGEHDHVLVEAATASFCASALPRRGSASATTPSEA